MANQEQIGETNFFIFTEGHFDPCEVPDREPDFVSGGKRDRSSYWYEGDTLIRQSNHWGTKIASCDWFLGDEPVQPNWKNKKLGQRAGSIKWEDFKTPDVDLNVFSPFGDLDLDNMGYKPVSLPDGDKHNYTTFKLDRSMFGKDNYRFSLAGVTLEYRGHPDYFLTAGGSAYSDPQASAAADAWAKERARAKEAEEPRPVLGAWIATMTEDPMFGELAKSMTEERLAGGQLVETELGLIALKHPGDPQASIEELWSEVLANIDEESRLARQVNGLAVHTFAPDILKTLETTFGKSSNHPSPADLSSLREEMPAKLIQNRINILDRNIEALWHQKIFDPFQTNMKACATARSEAMEDALILGFEIVGDSGERCVEGKLESLDEYARKNNELATRFKDWSSPNTTPASQIDRYGIELKSTDDGFVKVAYNGLESAERPQLEWEAGDWEDLPLCEQDPIIKLEVEFGEPLEPSDHIISDQFTSIYCILPGDGKDLGPSGSWCTLDSNNYLSPTPYGMRAGFGTLVEAIEDVYSQICDRTGGHMPDTIAPAAALEEYLSTHKSVIDESLTSNQFLEIEDMARGSGIAPTPPEQSHQYDCGQLMQGLQTFYKGQISGLGDGVCPMGSFEACAAEVRRLAEDAGEAGKEALAEVDKLEDQWKAAGLACSASSQVREVARVESR